MEASVRSYLSMASAPRHQILHKTGCRGPGAAMARSLQNRLWAEQILATGLCNVEDVLAVFSLTTRLHIKMLTILHIKCVQTLASRPAHGLTDVSCITMTYHSVPRRIG